MADFSLSKAAAERVSTQTWSYKKSLSFMTWMMSTFANLYLIYQWFKKLDSCDWQSNPTSAFMVGTIVFSKDFNDYYLLLKLQPIIYLNTGERIQ